jgi:hypothetical protein
MLQFHMLIKSNLFGLLMLLPLMACATDPSVSENAWSWSNSLLSPREQILKGLGEGPRTVLVQIDDTETGLATVKVEKTDALKGALQGAVEAGAVVPGPRGDNDPIGTLIWLVLTPIFAFGGAVYGAGSSVPITSYHSLEQFEGGTDLIAAAKSYANIIPVIREELYTSHGMYSHHRLLLSKESQGGDVDAVAPADVRIRVNQIVLGLLGEDAKSSRIRLYAQGRATVSAEWAKDGGWYQCWWSYLGNSHMISDLVENEANLFRIEITSAAKSVAEKIVAVLSRDIDDCPNMDQGYEVASGVEQFDSNGDVSVAGDCLIEPRRSDYSKTRVSGWTHVTKIETALFSRPAVDAFLIQKIPGCVLLRSVSLFEKEEWIRVYVKDEIGHIGFVQSRDIVRIEDFDATLLKTTNLFRLPEGRVIGMASPGTEFHIVLSTSKDGEMWYAADHLGRRIWVPKNAIAVSKPVTNQDTDS